jgi:hypothetical protein
MSLYCAICRNLPSSHGDRQECPDTWVYRDGRIYTTEELAELMATHDFPSRAHVMPRPSQPRPAPAPLPPRADG